MDFLFDENNPLIDQSLDLEAELFDLVFEMSDAEKVALLESDDIPDCVYEAIAKTFQREAA